MPQRHKLLKRIFLSFRVLAKNQICQCLNATRNRALLKVCKSGQASESSMPQAFESDFPNFRVLVKIKFVDATMPQAFKTDFPNFRLLAEIKFGHATTPQAFETDFPNFSVLAKIKFANATTPQRIARY